MPQIRARVFVTAPIHVAAKTVHQVQPRLPALGARVAGMRINPMLKRIHGRDPGKNFHDAFQMLAPRAPGIVAGIKFFDEFVAEQFHAHGGDFAKFNRRAAVGVKIFLARGQRVKGVAGFVQDRLHVALHADGVHENERQTRFGQGGLIAAGRFAFAIVQIQQLQIAASG